MKLLIGTTSFGKIHKWKILLPDVEVITPQDLNLHLDIKEGMQSLEENAKTKALAYARASNLLTLSEDVGLCIKELDNKPGIAVRRWGGQLPEDISDEDFMQFFRKKIENLTTGEAYFDIVIALATPDGKVTTLRHKYEGRIDKNANRNWVAGFPISSVFIRKDGVSWNQCSDAKKRELMQDTVQEVKTAIKNLQG